MNSVKKFFLTSVALCSIALFSMPTVIKAMTDQQNIINSVRIDVDASSNIVLTADELASHKNTTIKIKKEILCLNFDSNRSNRDDSSFNEVTTDNNTLLEIISNFSESEVPAGIETINENEQELLLALEKLSLNSSKETVECQICYDDIDISLAITMPCGHPKHILCRADTERWFTENNLCYIPSGQSHQEKNATTEYFKKNNIDIKTLRKNSLWPINTTNRGIQGRGIQIDDINNIIRKLIYATFFVKFLVNILQNKHAEAVCDIVNATAQDIIPFFLNNRVFDSLGFEFGSRNALMLYVLTEVISTYYYLTVLEAGKNSLAATYSNGLKIFCIIISPLLAYLSTKNALFDALNTGKKLGMLLAINDLDECEVLTISIILFNIRICCFNRAG